MKARTLIFSLTAAMLLASCNATVTINSGSAPASSNTPAGSSAAPASSQEDPASQGSQASEASQASQASQTSQASQASQASQTSEASQPVESSQASQGGGAEYKAANVMDHPVEITFMSNFSYQGTLDKIIGEFKKVEPNITVTNVKETGGYDDVRNKVVSQLATNEHPDMFVGYPDSVEVVMEYDKVVRLDDYMNNEVYGWTEDDFEDIIYSYLEEGQLYPMEGTYSLPFAKSTEALYYNADVLIGLDLSGIDPTINGGAALSEEYINNLTWEELFDHLIPAIQAKDESLPAEEKLLQGSKYDHTVFGYDSDDNLFITLAEQYGYGYTSIDEYGEGSLDFNNDDMKGLMKTFRKAYQSGGFITKGTNKNEYTNYRFTDNCALFTVGSTGGTKYQISPDFVTGVARIPHAEGKDPKVISQGPSLAILDHDDEDRALASWLFYRFLTNKVNAATWSIETGYAPVRYSVLEDGDYMKNISVEGVEPHSEDYIKAKAAEYVGIIAPEFFGSPVFKGSATARVEVGGLLSNCLLAEDLDGTIDSLFKTAIDNTLQKM